MMEMYSNPKCNEDKKEVAFLHLWKSIINGTLPKDMYEVYLNKNYILDFFLHGFLNRPKVVSLYVEVIMKILRFGVKCRPWKRDECSHIERSVGTAILNGFLTSIPKDKQEFCNVIKKTSSRSLNMSYESEEKFGVLAKNIIFILLNLMAEFQNMQLLCESFTKLIGFIHEQNVLEPLWLINIFLDDDELLFGVMLASVRIYKNLNHKDNIRTERRELLASKQFILHDTNPHALFLHFLQSIGYDHNECLSFLMSDETCCLLYLIEYLKLLKTDNHKFIQTYIMIQSDKEFNRKRKYQLDKSHIMQTRNNLSNDDDDCESENSMKIDSVINAETNGMKIDPVINAKKNEIKGENSMETDSVINAETNEGKSENSMKIDSVNAETNEDKEKNSMKIDSVINAETNEMKIDPVVNAETNEIKIDRVINAETNKMKIDSVIKAEMNEMKIDPVIKTEMNEMKIDPVIKAETNEETIEISKDKCNLVTYSSSSDDESCEEKESDAEDLSKVVMFLHNLRESIQKLVDINEFPYKITPFLVLLKSCEDQFR